MPRLRDLPEPHVCDLTETPQRFLASAHDSVETVLGTLDTIRQLRKQETGSIGGRLTSQEEDLLRAAIVFTGAGLDATLKRLVRDTLVHVIGKSEQAHKKLETFAAARLGTGEIADTKMIARYLVARDARSLLIDDYVYELSGSSLQSAEEVDNTAGALGIDDAELRKRINAQGLRDLFTARNEVAHELDLQRTAVRGDRSRRSRAMGPTTALCDEGFEVGQLIMNAVGAILTAQK